MLDDDENIVWCDADGNQDDNGCFDEGGHYYAERGADAADDYMDRMKDAAMGL